MAKHKNGKSKKQFTLPLAIVAGVAPLAYDIGVQVKNGDMKQAAMVAAHNVVGYNGWTGKWDLAGIKTGLVPILAGALVHKIAGAMGINAALARAGIPIFWI